MVMVELLALYDNRITTTYLRTIQVAIPRSLGDGIAKSILETTSYTIGDLIVIMMVLLRI